MEIYEDQLLNSGSKITVGNSTPETCGASPDNSMTEEAPQPEKASVGDFTALIDENLVDERATTTPPRSSRQSRFGTPKSARSVSSVPGEEFYDSICDVSDGSVGPEAGRSPLFEDKLPLSPPSSMIAVPPAPVSNALEPVVSSMGEIHDFSVPITNELDNVVGFAAKGEENLDGEMNTLSVRGAGRPRRRISDGLSMFDKYESSDSAPKYSQGEVDALVGSREAELTAAHEKTLNDVRSAYEGQMQVMQSMLEDAQAEAAQCRGAVRRCSEQDASIVEMSRRVEAFEEENTAALKAAELSLVEKKVQLDVITRQYLSIKEEQLSQQAAHETALAAVSAQLEAANLATAAVEESRAKLQVELDGLVEVEREKRTTAVLKMKADMKALATEQFAEANRQYRAQQQRLKEALAEVEKLRGELVRSLDAAKVAEESSENARVALANTRAEASARELAAAARAEALSNEVISLKGDIALRDRQLQNSECARDEAVRDRQAAQDSLARLAVRESVLMNENAELKEVSEQLLGMIEQQNG